MSKMYEKCTVEERCHKILEDNGSFVADKSRTILLRDPALKNFRRPLEFISKNWRDPLTPAMMSLSCEAVGGQPGETYETALVMSLMNLGFYIWDDIVDKATSKSFKPTLFGKFGESSALIIGGLASAKAFSILNGINMDITKRRKVTQLFWTLWTSMAKAETVSLGFRTQKSFSSAKKLLKIEAEASADVDTCLRIGAVIGNGSESEVKHLGSYGRYLGVVLELQKDFLVTVNLTLELNEKIRSGALPYFLLWARERSEKLRRKIEDLTNKDETQSSDIKEIVEHTLETNVLDNALKIMREYTEKAENELSELKKNKATETLKSFVRSQAELFIGYLSNFQIAHSNLALE